MRSTVGALVPGLILLAAVAGLALLLGEVIPLLTPLAFAIATGALLANTVPLPERVQPGLSAYSVILEIAIVLLGATLSLDALATAGMVLVALILATVAFGLLAITLLARAVNLNGQLGSLLAAGSSICGVSAIAAVAPACDADDAQIAHAAATILLFDAITLVAFPWVGGFLDVDPQLYGIWVGLSMFSTGPVAAAGFAHSPVAGQWATLTKLARNALIGVVVVAYSVWYTEEHITDVDRPGRLMWAEFPKFLIGFFLLVVLTSVGIISTEGAELIGRTSDSLFLLAFAGLGFQMRLGALRQTGIAPVGVVGIYLLAVSCLTYAVVALLF